MQDMIKTETELIKEMPNVKLSFPYDGDGKTFIVSLKVQEGFYRNVWFHFKFSLPETWPIDFPRIKILDKIWHPNIELLSNEYPNSGRVDISFFRNQFVHLDSIVDSLKFILINPNPHDALNIYTADQQMHNFDLFLSKVREYISDMEEEEENDT